MEPSITVQVFDHEMKAAVKELPPGCSIEAVRRALAQEKITCGIRWEAIKDAIAGADKSGLVLTNVTVAVAEQTALSVMYGKTGPCFSGEEVERQRHNLTAIGKAIRNGDASVALAGGVFVKADENALTVRIGGRRRNVYGEEITVSFSEEPFPHERCLTQKLLPDGYDFIAKAAGYLVINESGAFDIIDPFFTSADRLTLFCLILPLIYGKESFIEKVARTVSEAPPDGAFLKAIMAENRLQRLELRRGRPPVAGRPGSVVFLIAPNPELPVQTLDRIDYRDIGRFREVNEGTVIAEQVPMIQSVPGVDVFGEPINIDKMEEINFTCGEGIVKQCTPDLIRYIARERGVLELDDHYVNVAPQLTISGDVCSETGNIAYSRTVVVNGTVCAGFRVVCGNLTVRESIEDGAEIVCSGQLVVGKGIFGERTRVTVAGDANIGFIQGASLRVQGNCTIEEYAYHARIFCGGVLRVNGKGLTGREKGCVIGGDLSSMKTLDLHSAGSTATLTTLSCGFDPEGFETYKETVNLEKTLKKKVIQLQKRIHLNPNEKPLLLQRIQNAGAEQKEAFKQTLQELRATIALAEKAGASVALLARKTVAVDITRSRILIRNQLIPPTLIVFVNIKKKIYRESFGVRFAMGADEIIMHEGLTAISDDCGNATVPEASGRS
ncbi:MAG: DUF342 domain-containing protein [Chitinispirillaceae bacterium]|nr:DUF342 domain-containing protein [Chitinispirillaceae bacterium]